MYKQRAEMFVAAHNILSRVFGGWTASNDYLPSLGVLVNNKIVHVKWGVGLVVVLVTSWMDSNNMPHDLDTNTRGWLPKGLPWQHRAAMQYGKIGGH